MNFVKLDIEKSKRITYNGAVKTKEELCYEKIRN